MSTPSPVNTSITFVDQFLTSVPSILQFGFLGLSILMVLLGFLLFYKIVSQPKVDSKKIGLGKFFLILAFIFMIGSGLLQFGTDYIKKTVDVLVRIAPWLKDYGPIYGKLKVKKGKEVFPYEEDVIVIKIGDDQEIYIDLLELIQNRIKIQSDLDKCQSQLNDSVVKVLKKEEVGFSDAP